MAASKLPAPGKEALQLKSKSQWRYIGKGHPSYDLAAMCTGKAVYGMDARVNGMVYAAVMHPPVLGGKVKSFDDKETLKVKGVRQVVAIEPFKPPAAFQPLGGLAVIADNTWAAFQGRKKLTVQWDNGPNASTTRPSTRKNCSRRRALPAKSRARRETSKRSSKRQSGDRSRLLHAASRACADGTAGRGGGISRRQGDGLVPARKTRRRCRTL